MAMQEVSYLRNRSYLAAAASHLSIDLLNSSRVLLVAILAVSLSLSNAQVGLFLLLYNGGASVSQPLFGWLADRFGARWLVLGGLVWVSVFYAIAALVPEWPALYALTLASLGSGAFHPGGTKIASQTSRSRRTQATAFFFMAGQIGHFLGPILAGLLLDSYGRGGYFGLPMVGLMIVALGWRWLSDNVRRTPGSVKKGDAARSQSRAVSTLLLPSLVVVAVAYSTVSFSVQNFAPKLFAERGYSASYLGWVAGLYMMGSAVGGIVGGSIADRKGGRAVIFFSMLAAVAPIFLFIPAGDFWRFPLLLLAGFFGGMPHSIVVLQIQALLPGRQALASGVALGFMFFSGAVGSAVLGVVADHVGLATALQWSAVLMLTAAVAALRLPRQQTRAPAVAD